MQWNACVHRLDLSLYNHPRVFRVWSQNLCQLQGKKSPLLEALRRDEPLTLYHTGQQTQHTTDWAIQAPTPGLKESGQQMPECKPTLQFLKKSPKQGSLPWILIVQGKMSMKVHQTNKSQQHTKFNPHLSNTFYPQRRNVATSMVGLKQTATDAKISPKMVNPRDIARNAEEKEEEEHFMR